MTIKPNSFIDDICEIAHEHKLAVENVGKYVSELEALGATIIQHYEVINRDVFDRGAMRLLDGLDNE